MNLLIGLSFVALGAGATLVIAGGREAPSPHRQAEARALLALPPGLRRRMEWIIEKRAGKGAATAGQLALALLGALLGATALLFPFFKLAAVLPAIVIAFVVAQLYLQAQELKRQLALEQQTLRFLRRATANLSGATRVAPARLIGNLLARAGPPLSEEIAIVLAPLRAGQDFMPALEDALKMTRSKRLQRVLHLWRASEEEQLNAAGQAARFRALSRQEVLIEKLATETRLAAKKAQGSMYVVVGIIPALMAAMMALSPTFYQAYTQNVLGQMGLAVILGLEFLAIFLSRRIISQAQE